MNASKFCLTCGTAAQPVEHGVRWATVFFDLAVGGGASWFLSRVQPHLWWLPLAGALPTALAHAKPHPATCRTCGSTQLIPLDAPVAIARMKAMEAVADRVIAGESDPLEEARMTTSGPQKPN